jgi:sulfhydrogenase subunit delta
MKPKVAFFDFSSCEGCQLEALNLTPEQFQNMVEAIDIVNFREAMTEREESYEIAFIEGSITRDSEIPRLKKIRDQADILIALGACAGIGGINCLKNHLPAGEALDIVYGKDANLYDSIPARPISAVVPVDYYVRGCPPLPGEMIKLVTALLIGKQPDFPNYPVCVECKMANNICVFERGLTCLGAVTRAGCGAVCVNAGRHCWGCRGLVDEPNINSEKSILTKYGLTAEQVIEKFKIYDSYAEVVK